MQNRYCLLLKKKMKKKQIIITICSLLIILWVYAAGSKLVEYNVFVAQMARQPLPTWSTRILAIALPIIELTIAVLVYFPSTQTMGLLLSFVLMFCFSLYIGLVISHSLGEIPCSCSGIFQKLKWPAHLVLNIILSALAYLGWHISRKKSF